MAIQQLRIPEMASTVHHGKACAWAITQHLDQVAALVLAERQFSIRGRFSQSLGRNQQAPALPRHGQAFGSESVEKRLSG